MKGADRPGGIACSVSAVDREEQRSVTAKLGLAGREGIFSVSQVCRILQPSMTARKVHYWLDTGLLDPPVAWGGAGRPTLLDFKQLLQIRTVQHLRDELKFSLPKVRTAFEWILSNMFDEAVEGLRYERHGNDLVATRGDDSIVVPGGQGILELRDLNDQAAGTLLAWRDRAYVIPRFPMLVANARVQGGAPTVRGTRIETSFLASFIANAPVAGETVDAIARQFPSVSYDAVKQALEFEGLPLAA